MVFTTAGGAALRARARCSLIVRSERADCDRRANSRAEHAESMSVPGVVVLPYPTAVFRRMNCSIAAGISDGRVDRQGKQLETVGPEGNYRGLDISPIRDPTSRTSFDAPSGPTLRRFTFDASQENSSPIWSPDGGHIAFASLRNGRWGLYQRASNQSGNEELLYELADLKLPSSWSRDNSIILNSSRPGPEGGRNLWMLPLTGARNPVELLGKSLSHSNGQVSPDGKWLAYQATPIGMGPNTNTAGGPEIYVELCRRGTQVADLH